MSVVDVKGEDDPFTVSTSSPLIPLYYINIQ